MKEKQIHYFITYIWPLGTASLPMDWVHVHAVLFAWGPRLLLSTVCKPVKGARARTLARTYYRGRPSPQSCLAAPRGQTPPPGPAELQ